MNKEETVQTEVKSIKERPTRRPYENPGRLKFPEIPGFKTAVFAMDDPNMVNELIRAEQTGFEPVLAQEIGYDKLSIRPLKKDAHVIVNLGQGVSGILMKIPVEWYNADLEEVRKYNNSVLDRKSKDGKSDDKNLVIKSSLQLT